MSCAVSTVGTLLLNGERFDLIDQDRYDQLLTHRSFSLYMSLVIRSLFEKQGTYQAVMTEIGRYMDSCDHFSQLDSEPVLDPIALLRMVVESYDVDDSGVNYGL